MRISTALVMAAVFVRAAGAAPTRVIVCVDGMAESTVVSLATLEATALYAAIGIKLQWRSTGSRCPVEAIVVTLSDQTPPNLLPGAMALALPYEGTHIQVFYDRLGTHPGMRHHVLAYVLAHEIGHMLQRIARHSEEGVMKAKWSPDDYKLMLRGRLKFAPADIELILSGLETRPTDTLLAKRN